MNENRQIYESQKVINGYKKRNQLFPAEIVLYKIITNKQSRNAMLDLGIGAGRTTGFFASLFKQYIGIDISTGMIEVCNERFKNLINTKFINADVASLPELPANNFDFVLFSLNGIDYLKNLEERKILFTNIFNLLDNNGIFAFSTHNTNAINHLYSFQLPKRNPFKLITECIHYKKLRKINGPISGFINKEFFQLYDGGEYFKALTSYILPTFQLKLLNEAGFTTLKTFDIKGNAITLEKINTCKDNWIHYICYKN